MRVRPIILTILLLFIQAMRAGAQPPPCVITITCNVEEALVFVDHTLVGKAPLHAQVTPGTHEVRVSAGEEHVPFVTTVTIEGGTEVPVHAVLEKTAPALYRAGLEAFRGHDDAEARRLLEAASRATGKRASNIPFYVGLLDMRAGDARAAELNLVAWVKVDPRSATGQYHLGRARETLGQTALAATAYKSALLAAISEASSLLTSAGSPTQAAIARLEQIARRPGPAAAVAQLKTAFLQEQRGNLTAARTAYRRLFETLVSRFHVALDAPSPEQLPVTLAAPLGPEAPPAEPANTVYVTSDSPVAVGQAWRRCVKALPALDGAAQVSAPTNHWVALQARAFDTAAPDALEAGCLALSKALRTDVLFMQVTADGRAWYWYWNDGRELDRYCSNPGHVNEVDYQTIRSWAGKPDVLLRICRGRPLSATRPVPTMTDLNALLYYYYPEMRVTRPASYRTPTELMKTLASVLGLPCAPARYGQLGGFHAI